MTKPKPEKIFHVTDKNSLGVVIRAISNIKPSKEKRYSVKVYLAAENRTSKQNRLAFLWYKILAKEIGLSPSDEHNFCKLQYGIPILLTDPEFFEFYNNTMLILPYTEKLQAMNFIPVTRLMSTKHFAEYLNTIDRESAARGIQLPQPIDLYYDALMKQEDSR